MSSPEASRTALRVVLATFATQAAVTMSNSALPTIAPKMAEALGLEPALIGYQVSVLFGGAVAGTLFGGGLTRRSGACRTMQASLALSALGLAAMMWGGLAAIALGSLLAGFGQGLLNSATAHLLVKYTSGARRNLLFSIKQSGVPFGGMLVALSAPAAALAWGWQWTLALIAVLIVVLLVLLQSVRAGWDADRTMGSGGSAQRWGGVPLVMRERALRWLSLAGLLFGAMQRCLITFTVVFLVAEKGYTLVYAGIMLSMLHAGGIVGRLGWGWVADRYSSTAVLLTIAAISIVNTAALMAIESDWPPAAVYALFFLFGSAALGWNGILHAETARLSPPGMASVVAGGSTFFVFAGVLIGPSIFAALYGVTADYGSTFAMVAVAAAAGGLLVLFARGAAPAMRHEA